MDKLHHFVCTAAAKSALFAASCLLVMAMTAQNVTQHAFHTTFALALLILSVHHDMKIGSLPNAFIENVELSLAQIGIGFQKVFYVTICWLHSRTQKGNGKNNPITQTLSHGLQKVLPMSTSLKPTWLCKLLGETMALLSHTLAAWYCPFPTGHAIHNPGILETTTTDDILLFSAGVVWPFIGNTQGKYLPDFLLVQIVTIIQLYNCHAHSLPVLMNLREKCQSLRLFTVNLILFCKDFE